MSKTVEIDERELYLLRDKANLWDTMAESKTYVSFYTGYNATGGALREHYISERGHWDGIMQREAEKKAKRLGACSFMTFKPIAVPVNVIYGRDEQSRFEHLENLYE